MKFKNNELVCYDDVLLVPQYSEIKSRSDCDISSNIKLREGFILSSQIPIISANMSTITGPKMCLKMAQLGGFGILHRNIPLNELYDIVEDFTRFKFAPIIATGGLNSDKDRIDFILRKWKYTNNYIVICIDMAHGHSISMRETIEYIREQNKEIIIIAGNIATNYGAQDLISWGADVVKVGIGPGSVCTTRIKTGCGIPQLQAIMDISAIDPEIPIIADGGIRTPGDAAKALAAGADFIMIGGMLAGTDCVPGWDEVNTKILTNIAQVGNGYSAQMIPEHSVKFIDFRGMASEEEKILTGRDYNNAEGVSSKVLAQPIGSTEKVIKSLVEGIKSSMSYVGAKTLKSFRDKAVFIRVSNNTILENIPHKLSS